MSRIECVFFDCDGTLVDSEVICCQAYINIFIPYGVQLPLDEVIKTFKGMKLYDIIERISERFGLTVSMEQMERHFRQEVRDCSTFRCSRSRECGTYWRRCKRPPRWYPTARSAKCSIHWG